MANAVLQSALIGYYLDQKNNGNGYTTEAVNLVIDYAFRTLSLLGLRQVLCQIT